MTPTPTPGAGDLEAINIQDRDSGHQILLKLKHASENGAHTMLPLYDTRVAFRLITAALANADQQPKGISDASDTSNGDAVPLIESPPKSLNFNAGGPVMCQEPQWPAEVICYYPPGHISAMEVATELYRTELPHRVYRLDDAPKALTVEDVDGLRKPAHRSEWQNTWNDGFNAALDAVQALIVNEALFNRLRTMAMDNSISYTEQVRRLIMKALET